MTDIKIDTSEGLEVFLKILAEESVASSKIQVAENMSDEKRYQKDFVSRIQKDKKRFDEAEEAEPQPNQKDSETSTAPAEPSSEKQEEKPDEDINYYTIRNIINQIRAGDSTKDSEVAEPLEQYIMSDLDDDERELMYTFLLSVANIMNKTGQQPQDPSDPPVSLDVSRTKDKKSQPEKKQSAVAPEPTPSRDQQPAGPEDTTPPIQVGSQVTESIRKKVKELMRG